MKKTGVGIIVNTHDTYIPAHSHSYDETKGEQESMASYGKTLHTHRIASATAEVTEVDAGHYHRIER